MNNLTKQLSSKIILIFAVILVLVGNLLVVVQPVMAEVITVKMGTESGLLRFEPNEFTVKRGDTIKWVNNKLAPHNVIFNDEALKSMSHPQLIFAPRDFFETVVPQKASGEYDFYCGPHRGAGMVGKMTVLD
jgi:plastocyanin